MASTIIIKHGEKNAVPTSLTQGEFAINVDNSNLYYGSGSLNKVKQDLSLETLRISGSQTLATNVDANTPVIGTNMNSGVEIGTILVSGSFASDSTWDVNLAAIPSTNHSIDLDISLKVTKTDNTVEKGTCKVLIVWNSSDYTEADNVTINGVSYFNLSTVSPLQNISRIIHIGPIFPGGGTNSNFTTEGPVSIDNINHILVNWSDMDTFPLDDGPFDNADYEMVINYKVNKY